MLHLQDIGVHKVKVQVRFCGRLQIRSQVLCLPWHAYDMLLCLFCFFPELLVRLKYERKWDNGERIDEREELRSCG